MRKILLIEDDAGLAEVIKERLDMEGFHVDVASEGYRGIELAYRAQPDLIVLDLLLPTGSGLTVLESLKLSLKTQEVPVIVLTAVRDDDMKEQVMASGARAFLEKPYNGDELIRCIKEVLG